MSTTNEVITYESIEKWVKEKLDEYLGFDSTEMTAYLLSMETHHEMESYLEEFFGSGKKIKKFSETLIKKLSTLPRKVNKFQKVVTKPTTNQKNNQKKKDNNNTITQQQPKQKQTKQQIGSFSEIELQMRPGEPCECQATKHKLITNCLNCGKVICEQEGKGPCKFCQTPLFTNPANFSAHQKEQIEKNLLNAIKYKDTILGYQNTHAKRTIVYDDQEDYFENANNKWLSNDERAAVQKQEQEFKKKQEDLKKTTRISIDFVGRRIITENIKPTFEKLSFTDSSNNNNNNNNNSSSTITTTTTTTKDKDKDQQEKENNQNNDNIILSKMKYKSHSNNNNIKNNKKEMLDQGESIDESKDIITKQYYGVEEDSIVMKSMEVLNNNSFKFRGIVEGFWKYIDEKEPKSARRIPNITMYSSFLKMFKQRNCNYFIVSPEHYSMSFAFKDTVIPNDILKFLKTLFNEAQENKVTLNVAIVLPREFVFGDEENVDFIKLKLENYRKQVGVNDFSLILPSGFNDTFTQPICAPNSTKSEVNNSKTYSQTQTQFLNQLQEKTKSKPFNIMVCPSIFEMNLLSGSAPPSRQQIEYWLEINRSTPIQYPILFTTVQGSLQNLQLVKVRNIFDKRDMVVIEKYPYSRKSSSSSSCDELNIDWDPYRCDFADHKSQLAGVLASPFDKEFHIDNMSFVLTLSTFTQYLQSPFNYQPELSLRTNLIDLMGNDELAEDFSDVILALSNGIFSKIRSMLKLNNTTTADKRKVDAREKLFFTDLIEKSKQVYTFFNQQYPNDLITKKLDLIIITLSQYIDN